MNSLFFEEEAVAASSSSVIIAQTFNEGADKNLILVEGSSANDVLLTEGGEDVQLRGKEGNDYYGLGELKADSCYLIDQEIHGNSDRDTLNIFDYDSNDFYITNKNAIDLVLHNEVNGAVIIIKNWSEAPLKYIRFRDCRLSIAELGYAVGHSDYKLKLKGEYGFAGSGIVEADDCLLVNTFNEALLSINGDNNQIELSEGSKVIILDGENNIIVGSSDNSVKVENGTVASISFGEGVNSLVLVAGKVGALSCSGQLELTLQGAEYVLNKECPYVPIVDSGDNRITIEDMEVECLTGGAGNDVFVLNSGFVGSLKGGAGADVYELNGLQTGKTYVIDQRLKENVSERELGIDTLVLKNFAYEDFSFGYDRDLNLLITNKAQNITVRVEGWKDNPLGSIVFRDKEVSLGEISKLMNYYPVLSPLDIIREFSQCITESKNSSGDMFSSAVKLASQGLYKDAQALIDSFIQDCVAHSGSSLDDRRSFLKEYCGIDLYNEDTGAIIGLDAGNGVLRDDAGIVKEPAGMTVEDFAYNYTDKITTWDFFGQEDKEFTCAVVNCNGEPLTLFWDEEQLQTLAATGVVQDVNTLYKLIAGVVEGWSGPCFNLIKESFGISLAGKDSKLRTLSNGNKGLQLQLDYAGRGVVPLFVEGMSSNSVAALYSWNRRDNPLSYYSSVSSYQALVINTYFYSSTIEDVNGESSRYDSVAKYLDRILAHELTHAAMAANYYSYSNLPDFLLEGLAELVHGADDIRQSDIWWLVNPSSTMYDGGKLLGYEDALRKLFTLEDKDYIYGTYSYGGGYVLMRYFAKTAADYRLGLLSGDKAISVMETSVALENMVEEAQEAPKKAVLKASEDIKKELEALGIVQVVTDTEANYAGNTGTDIVRIEVQAGDNCIIETGSGNDFIAVNGGKRHNLKGAQGNDRFSFDVLETQGSYVIDQTDSLQTDRDILSLLEYNSTDFTVECLDGKNLVLHNINNGAAITIKEWCQAPLKYVVFQDGRLSVDKLGYVASKNSYALALNGEYSFFDKDEVEVDSSIIVGEGETLILKGNDNSVKINSGSFTLEDGVGNVITNKTEEGELTIKAGAGNVIECEANATIKVSGGIGTKVHFGRGQNHLIVSGGEIEEVTGGSGLEVMLPNSSFEVKDAETAIYRLKIGEHSAFIEGAKLDSLQASAGNDTIILAFDEIAGLVEEEAESLIVLNKVAVDTVKGGSGADKYILNTLLADHEYVIDQTPESGAGKAVDGDLLVLSNYDSDAFTIEMDADHNLLLTLKEQNTTIKVKGWAENPLSQLQFKDHTITVKELAEQFRFNPVYTQQEVIRTFIETMDNFTGRGQDTFDTAIRACSKGLYGSAQELIDSFISDCMQFSGSSYEERYDFLEKYCGINLNNADTGAISGYDAMGPVVKDKASVVQAKEGVTLETLVYDYSDKVVARDIFTGSDREFTCATVNCAGKPFTFYWDDAEFDILVEKGMTARREIPERMLGAIIEGWAEPVFDLIYDSYGVSLTEAGSKEKVLSNGNPGMRIVLDYVSFDNKSPFTVNNSVNNLGALYNVPRTEKNEAGDYVTNVHQLLAINTYRYPAVGDIDGRPGGAASSVHYIDRVFAHEMVHATLSATIDNYNYLPYFLKEGLGELIQGVDDHRKYEILDVVNTNNSGFFYGNYTNHEEYLRGIFSLEDLTYLAGTDSYGASYTLLRYLAKQVADYSLDKASGLLDNNVELEKLQNCEMAFVSPCTENKVEETFMHEEKDRSWLQIFANI